MPDPILSIADLNLRAADKRILADVAFSLPPVGMTALMGPVGSGKSTLLKWLTRNAAPHVYDATWSLATYQGRPIDEGNAPLLYAQLQAQPLDALMVSLEKLCAADPSLLCVDEPTAHMSRADANIVMKYLHRVAQDRAVLLVTHHQEDARTYADQVMLLAGGRMHELTPTAQFFCDPQTDIGRQFLGSGSAMTIGLDTPEHHVRPDLRQPNFATDVSSASADDRLRMIVDSQLYMLDVGDDPDRAAHALRAAGLNTMITMGDMDSALVGPDMICLTAAQDERATCQMVDAQIAEGRPVVFLRNGDAAAAPRAIARQLIFMGLGAYRAAKVAARLQDVPYLSPEDEQHLWDFELVCELAKDGIDPAAAEIDPPRITWSADVVARPRAASR
ncbi:ABC transporter ATP-binding protein [Cognatiyoonia sp. IB215182]|uniref:ATP-binding cassette domain-containing protein n=1 Tax=Cognatiyoonia sp. IB215182 TaxID=3097353 RepID=UPI002A132E39|nr:ATP-binding cassette domain-containing protein [Cognatiyoonia sp. IB215182]MDX8354921.1 ATP-binding cassette domain-containing protein [Cognatiyoonia sp. IB215182]